MLLPSGLPACRRSTTLACRPLSPSCGIKDYEHLEAKLDAMNAAIDESLLIALFFQSFLSNAVSNYAAIIAALQIKNTLSWVQASSRMLKEYQALGASDPVADEVAEGSPSGTEQALNVGGKDVTCWYGNKKGHRKSGAASTRPT